jgi:hypothetical protein
MLTEPGRSRSTPPGGTLETPGGELQRPGPVSASRRIRCHALKLAEQTYRPGALSDLYVIAGQATALMASTAFDLDRWNESATLARSAVSYAALVGNASLQAWALGLAALLANWRNEPDTALSHFSQGLQVAPRGTPRARLRYIAARSYALLGDSSSVARVVDQARRHLHIAACAVPQTLPTMRDRFPVPFADPKRLRRRHGLDLGRGHEAKEAGPARTQRPDNSPLRPSAGLPSHGACIDLGLPHASSSTSWTRPKHPRLRLSLSRRRSGTSRCREGWSARGA